MNIGLYQSAAALSAIERWQDVVSQNITSSDQTAYRKRTVSVGADMAGQLQTATGRSKENSGEAMPMLFPKVTTSINFKFGESQRTRRDLDVAIQGEGFFEVQRPDGSKIYTRNGEFRLRADRTLVTSTGDEVMSSAGSPIIFQPGGGAIVINQDGSIAQGTTALGRLAVLKFEDNNRLVAHSGGIFTAPEGLGSETVDNPEILQGYIEGSNTSSLREMVDLVLISRAYEANQKIISAVDDQMGKTLQALG